MVTIKSYTTGDTHVGEALKFIFAKLQLQLGVPTPLSDPAR